MKILFVCSGNTGRSPMAEFVLKKLVGNDSNFVIESAASKPTSGGDLHSGIAQKLREENVPYTKHTARQITAADYQKFDKIICMDAGNVEQVKNICGGDPQGKIQSWKKIFLGTKTDSPKLMKIFCAAVKICWKN